MDKKWVIRNRAVWNGLRMCGISGMNLRVLLPIHMVRTYFGVLNVFLMVLVSGTGRLIVLVELPTFMAVKRNEMKVETVHFSGKRFNVRYLQRMF